MSPIVRPRSARPDVRSSVACHQVRIAQGAAHAHDPSWRPSPGCSSTPPSHGHTDVGQARSPRVVRPRACRGGGGGGVRGLRAWYGGTDAIRIGYGGYGGTGHGAALWRGAMAWRYSVTVWRVAMAWCHGVALWRTASIPRRLGIPTSGAQATHPFAIRDHHPAGALVVEIMMDHVALSRQGIGLLFLTLRHAGATGSIGMVPEPCTHDPGDDITRPTGCPACQHRRARRWDVAIGQHVVRPGQRQQPQFHDVARCADDLFVLV